MLICIFYRGVFVKSVGEDYHVAKKGMEYHGRGVWEEITWKRGMGN